MDTVQAMLFDLDGTLVDSVPAHVATWQRALRACGVELPPEAIHPEIGKGSNLLIEDLVGHDKALQCGETANRLHTWIFTREFQPRLRPYPDVNGLFAELRQRGCRIAIASSAKRNHLDRLVSQIAGPIDVVVSGDDVTTAKPDPAIWRTTLHRLGLQASQSLMVGDSPHDFHSAAPLGLRGVAVLTGGFNDERLIRAGAQRVFLDLGDLRQHLDDLLPYPQAA